VSETVYGSFEYVGGPLDGEVRWGVVSGERRLPTFDGVSFCGTVVYRATDAINTRGNVVFRYAGTEPPRTDSPPYQ